jgi:hypothetical protein
MPDSDKPKPDTDHVVGQGDYTDYLAATTGHFWETIWNDPKNAGLSGEREHRNELVAGDVLYIPALRGKQENRGTDEIHRFKRKGVPFEIVYVVRSTGREVIGDAEYVLKIGNRTYKGLTDADGRLRCYIQPTARTGKLTITPEREGYPETMTFTLQIGPTPPNSTLIGRQTRLAALGYAVGVPSGDSTPESDRAIRSFRQNNGLDIDGGDDDAFADTLDAAYDALVAGE